MNRWLCTLLLGGLVCGATAFAQTPVPCPTDATARHRCVECSSSTSCTWWSWNHHNPSLETAPYETYGPGEGRHVWKTNIGRTGSASIAIIYPDDFPGTTDANDSVEKFRVNTWNSRLRIPAVAGKTYSARVYVQTEAMDTNVFATAALGLTFRDANNFALGSLILSNVVSASNQTWTALTIPATVAPTNTDRFTLQLRLTGNGAVYFDDLSAWDTTASSVNLLDIQP
jgi:hypothetical protein